MILERPRRAIQPFSHASGGWLIFPRPKPLPCRVLASCSLIGRVPGLYRELVPPVGEVLEDSQGYANLQSGRSGAVATLNGGKVMSGPNRSEILTLPSAVFAEDCLGVFASKVAASYLRYQQERCVAVVDSTKSGQSVADVLGYAPQIPIVDGVTDAIELGAKVLIIGKGLHSAQLPDGWKPEILTALNAGLHVISSIHYRISDDPDIAEAASKGGVTVWETK